MIREEEAWSIGLVSCGSNSSTESGGACNEDEAVILRTASLCCSCACNTVTNCAWTAPNCASKVATAALRSSNVAATPTRCLSCSACKAPSFASIAATVRLRSSNVACIVVDVSRCLASRPSAKREFAARSSEFSSRSTA